MAAFPNMRKNKYKRTLEKTKEILETKLYSNKNDK